MHLSAACLNTLLAQTAKPDVFIINNASTDGTGQWIRSQLMRRDNTKVWGAYRHTPKSVAHCWNLGLRWAWEEGLEEALVVNNDVELMPETYERLRDWLRAGKEREVGLVTGVSAGEEVERGLVGSDTESPHPDFSCWMLAKWAWERVGGLDEEYEGAYVEDADYHVRLHRAGIQAVSIDLPFKHTRSSTARNASVEERKRIEEYARRNRQRFFDTYGAWPGTKKYEGLFA